MGSTIPEGYGFIAGRGREKALAALAAADEAGIDQTLVRTTEGGYIVPLAVQEKYEETLAASQSPGPEPTPPDPAVPVTPENIPNPVGDAPAPTGEPNEPVDATDAGTDETATENQPASDEPASEQTDSTDELEGEQEAEVEYPAGNASTAAWLTFAQSRPNYDAETDAGLSRDDLRAKFGPQN